MRIRFLESTSAVLYSRPGLVRDVEDTLAEHLIDLNQAERADEPETATVAAPETAAARPRRKRGVGPDLLGA